MKGRMQLLKWILVVLTLVTFVSPAARGQFFQVCRTCSVAELIENIETHSEHVVRQDYKFDHYFYLQGELPAGFEPANLNDVLGFLDELTNTGNRMPAVLFYAYSGGRLCTWLMPPSNRQIRKHITPVKEEDFKSIRLRLMNALRSGGKVNKKLPMPRGVMLADESPSEAGVNQVLLETSNWLLPKPISDALITYGIDTLMVVPTFGIGTIPFSALPLGNERLVEKMSIVVAPGFHVFQKKPVGSQHDFSNPVIVGDPENIGWEDQHWKFEPLPGARAEVKEVADILKKSQALVGKEASKRNIQEKLRVQPGTGLIFLSTHGIADQKDPLDESFLLLSDGRWTAREMSEVELRGSRPLVVMSACQTGLGKNFDVGTIGMAKAWHKAGASSVVMSLWSVDDSATRDLMVTFIKLAQQMPPDKALQESMKIARKKYPHDPALWAGFSVFGTPEL